MIKPPPSKSKSATITATRPVFNSKLKESPFIANSRSTDTKLLPPASKIKNMVRRTVTRTTESSSSSSNQPKMRVRESIEKKAISNTASSNSSKAKASDSKATGGSITKELPPRPPLSDRRSPSSDLTSLPKVSKTTIMTGAVTKKMPKRPPATEQQDATEEEAIAVVATEQRDTTEELAITVPATSKPELTPQVTVTNDNVDRSNSNSIQVEPPKTSESLNSLRTSTNTSSAQSTSSVSAGGCSTSSNDDIVREDDGAVTAVMDVDLSGSTDIQTAPEANIDTGQKQDQGTPNNKFDPVQISYQLSAAHAQLTAVNFNTAPSMQVAEEWQQEYECLIASADQLRDRILVETDMQRSIASVLKLSNTSDSQMLNDLYTHTTHVDSLCHELSLTLAHAYDSRSRYLQHLAGTLAQIPPCSLSDPNDTESLTEREQALMQELAELQSRKTNEQQQQEEVRGLCREKEELVQQVDRMQSNLAQWKQQQEDQMQQCKLDHHHHIEDLKRTAQLRESEYEHEIAALRQAHNTHVELIAAKVRLEQALEEAQLREATLGAQHAEEMVQIKQAYQVHKADLEEREIRPLQEALAQARQKETELVTQLEQQHQQQQELEAAHALDQQKHLQQQHDREAQLMGENEEHVGRIHTLETQVEAMQAQMTRDEEKAALKEAELIAKEKSVSEAQRMVTDELKQALETTFCESLQDMVGKLQVFVTAQEAFTRRETAMMLQQASVEAELESLLKDYDRLTRNMHDSQLDRRHYESQIQALTREKQELSREVADYRVKDGIGVDGQTLTLRKEFRQLMASVKAEHAKAMEKEAEQQRVVKNEMRDIKHDLELKRWDRVSTGVQTNFVAYPGIV